MSFRSKKCLQGDLWTFPIQNYNEGIEWFDEEQT